LAGCGGGGARVSNASNASTPIPVAGGSCAQTVDATLQGVAARIYTQAASGRNVLSSRRRLARSASLAAAVKAGSPAATRAALRPLLKAQIHRIEIVSRGRVLARYGTSPALAPVHGTLAGGAGRYTMAVATDAAIAGVTQAVTGEKVSITRGTVPGALHATAFPHGALSIALVRPAAAASTCGADGASTVTDTIGAVAERLLHAEAAGQATARVLRHVARDRGFQAAVAQDDPAALRRAIIRFFRTRWLHVVRIRATTASGRLVGDVGGPFVLAPASGAVRTPGGRLLGHVTLSLQDDTGFIKLVRRFTGAGVVLRTAGGVVPGSTPAPTGSVFAFEATAFPSGPLHVTLHIASAPCARSACSGA
jgi:hypothetical protein